MSTIELEHTEEKRQHQNDQHTQIHFNVEHSTFIDLGWSLNSVDLHYPYQKKYYAIMYSLVSFMFSFLIVVMHNFIAVLSVSSINVILQFSVFMYGIYKYYRSKNAKNLVTNINAVSPLVQNEKYSNLMSPLVFKYNFNDYEPKYIKKTVNKYIPYFSKLHNFLNSYDVLFGRSDDALGIRPYYFRFSMMMYGVVTSIYTLCIILIYQNSPLKICAMSYGFDFIYGLQNPQWVKPIHADHLKLNGYGACTATLYIFEECVIPWILYIGFNLLDSYEVKKEYYKKLVHIKEKAMKTFNKSCIKNLNLRVEQQIYNNITSKLKLDANIKLFVGLFLVIFIILFSWRYSIGLQISMVIVFAIFSGVLYGNFALSLFKICILSKYSLIISTIFGEPIYCETRNDFLGWWQLRHIYKAYQSQIYTEVLNPVMYYGFIFIVILPFWAIIAMIEDKESNQAFWFYPMQNGTALIFIGVILYCMKQFVSGYEEQAKHVGMLQKELIRFEINENKNFDKIKSIIKLITEHMSQYDKPIKISGIPMTNAVFILLRGAISAVILLIIAEFVR
eukprot:538944_1